MKLVYKDTLKEVRIGDKAVTVNGEDVVVAMIEEPQHLGSTGRVYVNTQGSEFTRSYFPSVIGAHWIEREEVKS